MDQKRIVEAALFMSGRPLSAEELGRLLGVAALGYIEKIVGELAREYDERKSAVQVVSEAGKYALRLREEYSAIAKDFAKEAELSRGALKVLAYISKSPNVLKSSVVKLLGTSVYGYVKELCDKGFLEQKRSGRSSKLSVTEKFRQYFNVVETTQGVVERSEADVSEAVPEAYTEAEGKTGEGEEGSDADSDSGETENETDKMEE